MKKMHDDMRCLQGKKEIAELSLGSVQYCMQLTGKILPDMQLEKVFGSQPTTLAKMVSDQYSLIVVSGNACSNCLNSIIERLGKMELNIKRIIPIYTQPITLSATQLLQENSFDLFSAYDTNNILLKQFEKFPLLLLVNKERLILKAHSPMTGNPNLDEIFYAQLIDFLS